MKSHLVRRLGVRVVVAALGAAPVGAVVAASAQADTSAAGTSSCTDPALSQPFLPWGDSNWYALAPGEAPDDFAGTGWTLTGGAQIVTTALQDGRTGSVLNLPVGAKAVSPTICLTSAYPTADDDPECIGQQRRQRRLLGVLRRDEHRERSAPDRDVQDHRQPGRRRPWALSQPADLDPSPTAGWQLMRITLTANGPKTFQVYNLYNDPRMRS